MTKYNTFVIYFAEPLGCPTGLRAGLGIDSDKKALEVFRKDHNGTKSICGYLSEISYNDYLFLNNYYQQIHSKNLKFVEFLMILCYS